MARIETVLPPLCPDLFPVDKKSSDVLSVALMGALYKVRWCCKNHHPQDKLAMNERERWLISRVGHANSTALTAADPSTVTVSYTRQIGEFRPGDGVSIRQPMLSPAIDDQQRGSSNVPVLKRKREGGMIGWFVRNGRTGAFSCASRVSRERQQSRRWYHRRNYHT